MLHPSASSQHRLPPGGLGQQPLVPRDAISSCDSWTQEACEVAGCCVALSKHMSPNSFAAGVLQVANVGAHAFGFLVRDHGMNASSAFVKVCGYLLFAGHTLFVHPLSLIDLNQFLHISLTFTSYFDFFLEF